MKYKKVNYYSLVLLPILFFYRYSFNMNYVHQNFVATSGDTSAFKANQQAGWSVYSSYLDHDTPDSVEFEFLIQHADNIDWNNEQFIGVIIKNAYKPANRQQIPYELLIGNLWGVRIEPTGQCFLKRIKGRVALGDPVIFPVRVKFKRT